MFSRRIGKGWNGNFATQREKATSLWHRKQVLPKSSLTLGTTRTCQVDLTSPRSSGNMCMSAAGISSSSSAFICSLILFSPYSVSFFINAFKPSLINFTFVRRSCCSRFPIVEVGMRCTLTCKSELQSSCADKNNSRVSKKLKSGLVKIKELESNFAKSLLSWSGLLIRLLGENTRKNLYIQRNHSMSVPPKWAWRKSLLKTIFLRSQTSVAFNSGEILVHIVPHLGSWHWSWDGETYLKNGVYKLEETRKHVPRHVSELLQQGKLVPDCSEMVLAPYMAVDKWRGQTHAPKWYMG